MMEIRLAKFLLEHCQPVAQVKSFLKSAAITAATATVHARGRHGRQRPAERVNEQRAWTCFGRERPIKHFDLVREGILGQVWIANDYRHFFGDRVSFRQEGKNRVRGVLGEVVVTHAPIAHELVGMHMAHDPLWTVRKEQRRVCLSMKRHGTVTRRHPVRTLHKHGLDIF